MQLQPNGDASLIWWQICPLKQHTWQLRNLSSFDLTWTHSLCKTLLIFPLNGETMILTMSSLQITSLVESTMVWIHHPSFPFFFWGSFDSGSAFYVTTTAVKAGSSSKTYLAIINLQTFTLEARILLSDYGMDSVPTNLFTPGWHFFPQAYKLFVEGERNQLFVLGEAPEYFGYAVPTLGRYLSGCCEI